MRVDIIYLVGISKQVRIKLRIGFIVTITRNIGILRLDRRISPACKKLRNYEKNCELDGACTRTVYVPS